MVKFLTVALLLAGLAAPVAARSKAIDQTSAEFDCDAIAINQPLDRATLRDLGPVHSLDDAAAVLTRHGVKYERGPRVLTLNAPAKQVRQITLMKQGEPIILPNGDGSAICVLMPSADSI